MQLTAERRDKNSGFSLVEVLAALAIAAALSAALVHTFSNTRYNAGRIRELIDMMTLGDNLLAQINAEKIQAARIDGHDGRFIWSLDVNPASYAATVIQYSENVQPDQTTKPSTSKEVEQQGQSGTEIGKSNNEAAQKWSVYRIRIGVQAPSGRRHVVETFRIGQRITNEKQE
jgi:prepilin-type N-terminal cleavage/methylation domain-containing protein